MKSDKSYKVPTHQYKRTIAPPTSNLVYNHQAVANLSIDYGRGNKY